MSETIIRYPVPPLVAGKAHAAGEVGEKWLADLDALVDSLAAAWHIRVGEVLHGGSHALVCAAETETGEPCVLKVEIPDLTETEFMYGIHALRIANGHGYARLIAYDKEKRACLTERLGRPLKQLGYTVEEQIKIICRALVQTWAMPVGDAVLQQGDGSINWFAAYIPQTWENLGRPCPQEVIDRALACMEARKRQRDPAAYVVLHGDAHNNNTLEVPGQPGMFKLIDSEGILYEKAYDLGVLMREWPEEYRENPAAAQHKRADLLHNLTGVDTDAILDWGYLQMVTTALVLLQSGETVLSKEMLDIAKAWCI